MALYARIQNSEAWVLNMHIATAPEPERFTQTYIRQSGDPIPHLAKRNKKITPHSN